MLTNSLFRDARTYLTASAIVGPINLMIGLLPAYLMTNSQFNNYLLYAIGLNFIFSGFLHLFKLVYKYPGIIHSMLRLNFIVVAGIFLILKFFSEIFISHVIFDVLLLRVLFFSTFQMVQISNVATLSKNKFLKMSFAATGSTTVTIALFYHFDLLTIYWLLVIEASVFAIFTFTGTVSIWRNIPNVGDLNFWKNLKTKNAVGLFLSGLLGSVKMNLLFFILSSVGSSDTKLIYLAKYALDFFHNFSANVFIKLYPRLILGKAHYNILHMYALNVGIRAAYISIILLSVITFIDFSTLENNLFLYVYVLDFLIITSLFSVANYQIFSKLENYFLTKVDMFRVGLMFASASILFKFSPSEIIYINQIGNLAVFGIFVFYIKTRNKL